MEEIESSFSLLVEKKMFKIDSENLAYWYFRLNGFLTIQNFVVHPNSGSQQRTEIDIIAARFPYRIELPENENPMQDDDRLKFIPDKIRIVLAEVKTNKCKLNHALINSDGGNVHNIISAIGLFESHKVDFVSKKLYEHGYYEDKKFLVSLCCLGKKTNNARCKQFPKVPQLTWNSVLSFIYDRFEKYEIYKRQHQQWDSNGRNLFKHFQKCYDRNEFIATIEIAR